MGFATEKDSTTPPVGSDESIVKALIRQLASDERRDEQAAKLYCNSILTLSHIVTV
jgi:hypothetical protein